MPKTLQYRPKLIDELISNERINSYKTVFSPNDDVELMGVYLWNTHVCGAIYPLVCAAEITLRNSIDQALTASLGKFWWAKDTLPYKSFNPKEPEKAPKPVQNLRKNFSRAAETYMSERKKRYRIKHVVAQHHCIIAKTDFSTWQLILDDEFMGDKLIWPSRLGTAFAGTWPSKQASTTLVYSRDLVKTIREFRNRIFHHEPAWKRFGVSTEADAIKNLHEKIGKIESLISLIHPENSKLLEKNWLLKNAYRACSSNEIRRFQHLTKTHKIKSISDLRVLVGACIQENSISKVKFYHGIDQDFLIVPI